VTDATLADVLHELRALRREVAALRPYRHADVTLGAFLAAVDDTWGNAPFRAGELLAWAANPAFASRRVVLDAVRQWLGADAGAHALGLRLSAVADTDVDRLRLVRVAAKERGARLWAVLRLRD
jgi:hypothetical protein